RPRPIGPAAARRFASSTRVGRAARAPARTARNWARVRSRSITGVAMGRKCAASGSKVKPRLGGELLTPLGAAAGQRLPNSGRGNTGAETMPALPYETARLIGPLGAHFRPLGREKRRGSSLPTPRGQADRERRPACKRYRDHEFGYPSLLR